MLRVMVTSLDGIDAIVLRRAEAVDAERLHAWRSEPSARRYQPLRSVSVARLREQLATEGQATISPRLSDDVRWIVEAAEGPVGWISLRAIVREHAIGDIGYTIGERFRGRGYATAALLALLPIAFDPNGAALVRLQAVAAVANVASRRVLEQAGFRGEGIARSYLIIDGARVDHARYALLLADWQHDRP